MLIDELKYVFLFKRNLKFLQPRQVFILECSPSVMKFLVSNVANDRVELRMTIRERAETFLPTETADHPFLAIHEIG